MGLERAREFADDLRRQALESLSPFGQRRQRLVELTDFISQRKF
jgi:geranylgeranyl pyrophosphate synthase